MRRLRNEYLAFEKVKVGSLGGYNFETFSLTELGKYCYKLMTNKQIKKPQKEELSGRYRSLDRGYFVTECIDEFHEMGYIVNNKKDDVTFHLRDGRRKEFDFLIEKDEEKKYITVLRYIRSFEDFHLLLDKTYEAMESYEITPIEISFIASNEETIVELLKKSVFSWEYKRLSSEPVTIYFTTFDKIKKHHSPLWESIHI